jgi:hypothetical protein
LVHSGIRLIFGFSLSIRFSFCQPIFRVKGNFVTLVQVAVLFGRLVDEGFNLVFLEFRYVF